MPLAISTLYFLPFIILGVLLVAMLVLYLLARIQNGRFLRPLVTQLSKIAVHAALVPEDVRFSL